MRFGFIIGPDPSEINFINTGFSGLIISLLFTRISSGMSRLYAFDLVGAAVGCLLIVWTMPSLGGSGSVIMSATLGSTAALAFSNKTSFRIASVVIAIAIGAFAFTASKYIPIAITTNKRPSTFKAVPIYTKWNTFSYIELFERPGEATGKQRRFVIDGGTASTGMDDLSGGLDNYLKKFPSDTSYLSAVAYLHIPNQTILNIGSGGGQEVLDGLHRNAGKITCVEINPIITNVVKNKMNDFWGGLFRHPNVELITEEGRSFINRSNRQFDVIVSSHTISNAAVASGALSLSENYVLTKEAFEKYYEHLSSNGTIFFTRPESQIARLFTTGREVMADHGVNDFANHFYAFRVPPTAGEGKTSFAAGFVMKKSAFTNEEIQAMDLMILNIHNEVKPGEWKPIEKLYSPFTAHKENIYDSILNTNDLAGFYKQAVSQIAPATDDRPFFNQHVRWSSVGWKSFKDVFSQNSPIAARMALENKPVAEVTLLLILMQSIILAGILILIPLFRYSK